MEQTSCKISENGDVIPLSEVSPQDDMCSQSWGITKIQSEIYVNLHALMQMAAEAEGTTEDQQKLLLEIEESSKRARDVILEAPA